MLDTCRTSWKKHRGLMVYARLVGTLVAALLMVLLGTRYLAAATAGRIFFVAPTGNDANDCSSFVTACRTISATVAKAGSGDLILITPGTYTENVTIDKNLTLIGFGSESTILDGSNGSLDQSVVTVLAGVGATIDDLTIAHGNAYSGGGIKVLGELTLTNGVIRNNQGGVGGGIQNFKGNLILVNTHIVSNRAIYNGGGIDNIQGMLTLRGSMVMSNTVWRSGGGIDNEFGSLVVDNSAIFGNMACNTFCPQNVIGGLSTILRPDVGFASAGGGITNDGVMTVTNSTFVDNDTYGSREGIENEGTASLSNVTISNGEVDNQNNGISSLGSITLTNVTIYNTGGIAKPDIGSLWMKNTIVANVFGRSNCNGMPSSLGHNLDSGSSCGLNASGDLTATNPLLGPLQDNGGPTPTHALLPGSPAINAGDINGFPLTDQRGVRRPQGAFCDIGAFEMLINGTTFTFLPLASSLSERMKSLRSDVESTYD